MIMQYTCWDEKLMQKTEEKLSGSPYVNKLLATKGDKYINHKLFYCRG